MSKPIIIGEHRKNDLSKGVGILMVFITMSFLMLATFQWRYDFSPNIWTIRIWQYLLAFFGGGALGVAGVLLQKLTRNSLADISILGIGSLNIIFIVTYILLRYDGTIEMGNLLRIHLPLISIASSILGTSIIYFISKDKPDNCNKFALTGIAFQFICEAVSVALSSQKLVGNEDASVKVGEEIQNYAYGRFPDVQSLSQSHSWRTMVIVSICLISIIVAIAYLFRRELDLIEINEDLAKFYGIRVKVFKGCMYLLVALLAGIESAMIGSISLLGIVAASLSRMIFGNKSNINIIAGFMMGGILVLTASFISMNLNRNIPIGFLSTSIIAPVFLYLLFKRK